MNKIQNYDLWVVGETQNLFIRSKKKVKWPKFEIINI